MGANVGGGSLLHSALSQVVAAYGYWAVFGLVALESGGIPLPGETALILAAVIAGSSHRLALPGIVVAAAAGAILGDNLGFWVGRGLGLPLLRRYGRWIGLDPGRLKIGQYLFLRHGGKIVFFGRFVAVLRALAALLAGANRMRWRRFLPFNAGGGILWATLYGGGGYLLGNLAERLAAPLGYGLLGAAAVLFCAIGLVVRRAEARLRAAAETALPDEAPGAGN